MKKLLLLAIMPSLLLTGCNKESRSVIRESQGDGENITIIVDNNTPNDYKKITKYQNDIYYKMDLDTMKFHVTWVEYNNGYATGTKKEWYVYLKDFYMVYHQNTTFYECLKKDNTYDYYLAVYY